MTVTFTPDTDVELTMGGKLVIVTVLRSALNCSPMETDSTKGPGARLNVVLTVAMPVNVVFRGPSPTKIVTEALPLIPFSSVAVTVTT